MVYSFCICLNVKNFFLVFQLHALHYIVVNQTGNTITTLSYMYVVMTHYDKI